MVGNLGEEQMYEWAVIQMADTILIEKQIPFVSYWFDVCIVYNTLCSL